MRVCACVCVCVRVCACVCVRVTSWPRLTILGQSVGSMIVAASALWQLVPDVFLDTTGYGFTYPVARVLGGCRVATYTHYPTITTVCGRAFPPPPRSPTLPWTGAGAAQARCHSPLPPSSFPSTSAAHCVVPSNVPWLSSPAPALPVGTRAFGGVDPLPPPPSSPPPPGNV